MSLLPSILPSFLRVFLNFVSSLDEDEVDCDDEPPVSTNELQRVQHLLGDMVADDRAVEQGRARDFNCECSTFKGKPCIKQFTVEEVCSIRLDMQGLTEGI